MTKKKAKKTTKKVIAKPKAKVNYDVQIQNLTDLVLEAALAITAINTRIDRIVYAIDRSKKVGGL